MHIHHLQIWIIHPSFNHIKPTEGTIFFIQNLVFQLLSYLAHNCDTTNWEINGFIYFQQSCSKSWLSIVILSTYEEIHKCKLIYSFPAVFNYLIYDLVYHSPAILNNFILLKQEHTHTIFFLEENETFYRIHLNLFTIITRSHPQLKLGIFWPPALWHDLTPGARDPRVFWGPLQFKASSPLNPRPRNPTTPVHSHKHRYKPAEPQSSALRLLQHLIQMHKGPALKDYSVHFFCIWEMVGLSRSGLWHPSTAAHTLQCRAITAFWLLLLSVIASD